MSSDGASRPGFARYREILDAHGFRPSKKLGQNFLLDPSLHRAIADAAEITAGDVVLEVGAGLGFLTRELACRARRVVTVEIDDRLATVLRDEVASWSDGDRVQLVHHDALAGPGVAPAVADAVREAAGDRPVAVVANLPYAVSGRFLGAMLGGTDLAVDRAVVVIQLELAERIAAGPGSRDYGSLSVLAQARGTVELVRRIGRDVFRPRPKVDSAVLRLRCGERALPDGFAVFVRRMFEGRRKVLRHALRAFGGVPEDVFARFGDRRAEQCTVDDFLAMHASLAFDGPADTSAGQKAP